MVAATATVGRQVQTISLVGAGHFLSHLYQLALPPLFVWMKEDLQVSYAALGLALLAYSVSTAALQTPVGILVDRVGARWVLAAGLLINAVAMVGIGLSSGYWDLVLYMLLAGVGNSVFHPADYAILSSSIRESLMGRAFSIHAFSGTTGFMVAPLMMIWLAKQTDWRTALFMVGAVGIGVAGLMAIFSGILREHAEGAAARERKKGDWREFMTWPIAMFFLFYALSAAAGSGISAFATVGLVEIYGVDETLAGAALTLFFACISCGVLMGGFLADRTKRHDHVLVVTYGLTAIALAVIGTTMLPFWGVFGAFVVAGLMRGLVNPSRDVLVRAAAPAGAVGVVFGFVTTGFSVGQGLSPLLYGWLMDIGSPAMVFWIAAGFTVLALLMVVFSREQGLYRKM